MTQPLDYASPQPKQSKKGRRLFGWLLFAAVAALVFVWLKQSNPSSAVVPLSTLYPQIRAGNVARMVIDGDVVIGKFRTPIVVNGVWLSAFRTFLPTGVGGNWGFSQWVLENAGPRTEFSAEPTNDFLTNIILPIIPWLLILAFIWFFVFRQLRRAPTIQKPLPVIVVNPEVK